jgi:hypothetical protein
MRPIHNAAKTTQAMHVPITIPCRLTQARLAERAPPVPCKWCHACTTKNTHPDLTHIHGNTPGGAMQHPSRQTVLLPASSQPLPPTCCLHSTPEGTQAAHERHSTRPPGVPCIRCELAGGVVGGTCGQARQPATAMSQSADQQQIKHASNRIWQQLKMA